MNGMCSTRLSQSTGTDRHTDRQTYKQTDRAHQSTRTYRQTDTSGSASQQALTDTLTDRDTLMCTMTRKKRTDTLVVPFLTCNYFTDKPATDAVTIVHPALNTHLIHSLSHVIKDINNGQLSSRQNLTQQITTSY